MVRSQQLRLLRFRNDQVMHDLGTVLELIATQARQLKQEITPLPRGEGQG